MSTVQLDNFACYLARRCLKSCGMCGLEGKRQINKKSLFGICRELGYCVDDCGACKTIAKQSIEARYYKRRPSSIVEGDTGLSVDGRLMA